MALITILGVPSQQTEPYAAAATTAVGLLALVDLRNGSLSAGEFIRRFIRVVEMRLLVQVVDTGNYSGTISLTNGIHLSPVGKPENTLTNLYKVSGGSVPPDIDPKDLVRISAWVPDEAAVGFFSGVGMNLLTPEPVELVEPAAPEAIEPVAPEPAVPEPAVPEERLERRPMRKRLQSVFF